MPTFNIDQKSEGLTIVVAGEPTEAYVWERKDGEFKNTGELKKNADGVQIWNVPATVIAPGSPRPIATKITIESSTKPDVPVGQVEADGLGLVVREAQLSATALKAPASGGFAKSTEAKA